MFLHRIHLDLRNKEARRDVADPYEMHSTLCRAFNTPEEKCPPGTFLWRLEPEQGTEGIARIIIQSQKLPDWTQINLPRWFKEEPTAPLDLINKLGLASVNAGQLFRYRLRANPTITRNRKRIGLFSADDQISWLQRQSELKGFTPVTIHRSDERMLTGKIRTNKPIRVFSVLFDGILTINDPVKFREAIECGIGHGKSLGLGLLSVVPAT